MPPIKGLYRTNPATGADGVWLDAIGPGLRGLARSAFPNPTGQQTPASYSALISAQVTALFETSRPVSDFPPGDPLLTTPEPFCRVSNGQYICQPFVVTVTFSSLRPLVLESVEVGGGATEPPTAHG